MISELGSTAKAAARMFGVLCLCGVSITALAQEAEDAKDGHGLTGVGFDGVRRKPRKRSKTGQFVSEPALIPYDDAPVAEAPESIRAPVRSRRCGMSTQ